MNVWKMEKYGVVKMRKEWKRSKTGRRERKC